MKIQRIIELNCSQIACAFDKQCRFVSCLDQLSMPQSAQNHPQHPTRLPICHHRQREPDQATLAQLMERKIASD